MHIIGAVLKPPPETLVRPAVYQALQDFGVKGSMMPIRRLGPQCRRDSISQARLRLLVGGKAYWEEAPEIGQGTGALQVPACLQALHDIGIFHNTSSGMILHSQSGWFRLACSSRQGMQDLAGGLC